MQVVLVSKHYKMRIDELSPLIRTQEIFKIGIFLNTFLALTNRNAQAIWSIFLSPPFIWFNFIDSSVLSLKQIIISFLLPLLFNTIRECLRCKIIYYDVTFWIALLEISRFCIRQELFLLSSLNYVFPKFLELFKCLAY